MVLPVLVFGQGPVGYGLMWRRRGLKGVPFDWSWRRLAAPGAWLPAALLSALAALGTRLVPRMGQAPTWACVLFSVAPAMSWLTASGVRVALGREGGERRKVAAPERLMLLSAVGGAVGMGAAAWIIRLVVLPVAEGEVTPGPPWHSVTWVLAWLDGQIGTSLFGPSFERSYWPLLPAGAGFVCGLVTMAARQASERVGAARNPFADATGGTGGRIFLSYSRRDTDFARSLTTALQGRVREVWVDWQAIKPSLKWRQSIADGIRASDALVVLLSRNALRSPYCWDECRQAIEQRKRILPIVIDPALAAGTGAALREAGWEELSAFQRLDMSRPDRSGPGVEQIAAFAAQEHRWVAGHTRLGLQAHEWRESGRSDDFLLREDELWAAEWLRDHVPASPAFMAGLTEEQHEFLDASRLALRRRRSRLLAGAVAVLVTITTLFSLVVSAQSGADADRRESVSRQLATASRSGAGGRLDTSSLLAAAAYDEADTPEARRAMVERLTLFNHAVRLLSGPSTGASGTDGPGRPMFSADGSTLAVARADGTTQLWDVKRWRLRGTLRGLPGRRSLTADGRMVALLNGTHVTVTDTGTMRTVASFRAGEDAEPFGWSGGLSPDGRILVVSTSFQRALTWSVPERRLIARSDASCQYSDLSPSGRWLWCQTGAEGLLHDVLTSSSPKDLHITLKDNGVARLLGWTASDEAVIDDGDNQAEVLPAAGRGRPWTPERGMSVQYVSADGRRALLSDSGEKRFDVWDLLHRRKLGDVSPDRLKEISGPDSDEQVVALVNLPVTYGMRLATGGGRNTDVWDVSDTRPAYPQVVFSPDGHTAASVTATGVIAWDRGPTGRLVSELPVEGRDGAASHWSAVSPDGSVVAGVSGHAVRFFDTSTGRLRGTIRLKGSGNGIAYSGNGARLAVSEKVPLPTPRSGVRVLGTIVEVFALPTRTRVARINSDSPNTPPQETTGLALSPDGRRLYLAVNQDSLITVWDVDRDRVVRTYGLGYVRAMSLSPDGRRLAAVDSQNVLSEWDTTTGRPVLSYRGAAGTVAFSRDGRTLAAASPSRQSLLLFEAATGHKLGADIDTGSTIRAVRLSNSDGVAVITLDAGSDGGAVVLWDLLHRASTGPVPTRTRTGTVAEVTADGRRAVRLAPGAVVSVTIDPRTWRNTLCSVAGRPLLRQEWRSAVTGHHYTRAC
ncbi:TIR domain-containing protein [Streptomyces capoamus]|uniref:TIR domain-containing protein n=1 Tax=Streptomyces capoamus TaxID=68183 RepID=UPI00339B2237